MAFGRWIDQPIATIRYLGYVRIMRHFIMVLLLVIGWAVATSASDWPVWRGPTGNGFAPRGPAPPVSWSPTENVIWSTPVPGRGHGSPTVFDQRIYLATADEQAGTQSIVAYDRDTGELLWQRVVYLTTEWPKIHEKNTHASSTVACDGERLYATFYSDGKIRIACLGLEGNRLWQKDLARFDQKYLFGYAASPVLYNGLVIVASEAESETSLIALRTSNGQEAWRTPRPRNSSYSSPAILKLAGRDQLVISGNKEIRSYDPSTGREYWRAPGSAQHTCGTVTGEGSMVVASGGYPEPETVCVMADGTGRVLWRNRYKAYEQSLLIHGGFVYMVTDAGVGICIDARTGKDLWRQRLEGPVSSSPILVGDRIYVASERGTTFVFKADPRKYVELARNRLGDDAFPTPAFLDGRIYTRVGVETNRGRQEMLYCLGE